MKETFFEYLDIIQGFFQNIINQIMNYNYSDNIVDFFTNLETIDFFKGAMIYFFILWIAIIIWVTRDILSRSNSIILQLLSILLIVFLTPILGLPVYFMIRPSVKKYDDSLYEEVLEEIEVEDDEPKEEETKEEEIEKEMKKEELIASFEKITCYNCHYHIEEDFKFCPNCEIQLLDNCKKCSKQIKTNWKICPYCGDKKEQEEKQENKTEEIQKKKGFFANLFSSEKEKLEENKETTKIKIEKSEKNTLKSIDNIDEKQEKILEVEKIKKEIEKAEELEITDNKNNSKKIRIDKKKEDKNPKIILKKSRRQKRREKYLNKKK